MTKEKKNKSADSRRSGDSGSGSGSGSGSKKSKTKSSRRSATLSKAKSRKTSSKKTIAMSRRPTSLSSVASQYNTPRRIAQLKPGGLGEDTTKMLKLTESLVVYNELIYDTVQLYLHCPTHKKLALSGVSNRGLYLPYYAIRSNEPWIASAMRLLHKLMRPREEDSKSAQVAAITSDPVMVDALRLQLPIYYDFVTRITYYMELTPEACKAKYCEKSSPYMAWYKLEDLVSGAKQGLQLLGPEPQMLSDFLNGVLQCREVTIVNALPSQEDLLRDAGVTEEDILRIYGDFLQQVFPSEYMTFESFTKYIEAAELKMTNTRALFRAFNFNQRAYMNFHEFILGLAVVGSLSGSNKKTEPQSSESTVSASPAPNPAVVAKFKADFLFRYFAATGAAYLTGEELKKATSKCSLPKEDAAKLTSLLKDGHLPKSSFTSEWTKILATSDVICSSILRSDAISPIARLRIRTLYLPLHRKQTTARGHKALEAKIALRFLCENCKTKQYSLSLYMMKLGPDGSLYGATKTEQADAERKSEIKRELSKNYFSSKFICHQLMDMIRIFAAKLKLAKCQVKDQNQPDWRDLKVRQMFGEKIFHICKQAKAHFAKGPRVIKVSSPCYVIGDIHGNLKDLILYEQSIWRNGAYLSTANLLFLGDYVDRGDYGVECIIFLLCMKCMAPDRVHLLRGNHETREQQKQNTFDWEVNDKFYPDGATMFEVFNTVFDVMPLAAVVDEAIYCAHGGIPASVKKVEQLAVLPCPLVDPDSDPLATEILWNDPITNHEYEDLLTYNAEAIASAATAPQGFIYNTKRCTGFYYSNKALKDFLAANGFSHVIRAHECIPPGFQFHGGGQCITVFSSSHYCQGINEAAVALVHDSQIRVIKVDTPRIK